MTVISGSSYRATDLGAEEHIEYGDQQRDMAKPTQMDTVFGAVPSGNKFATIFLNEVPAIETVALSLIIRIFTE